MLEMIDAILELSRFARGKLQRDNVDLSSLVRATAAQLVHAHPERAVEFRIADGLVVRADAQLIKVVLDHLVGNAWKFTSTRPDAVIEFAATQWDGRLAFVVRDNGVGFDMTYADKLFTPFQRLHSQEEFQGRGVGLAIVRRIINRHGGRIKGEAEPGQGAAFTFTV